MSDIFADVGLAKQNLDRGDCMDCLKCFEAVIGLCFVIASPLFLNRGLAFCLEKSVKMN